MLYRIIWVMLIVIGSISAQKYESEFKHKTFDSKSINIEKELMIALKYNLQRCYNFNETQTESLQTTESKIPLWVYPIMYGSEYVVAECSTLFTLFGSSILIREYSDPYLCYGGQVLYVVSNAFLSSSLIAFIGKNIFKKDGSRKLSAITTLAASTFHMILFNFLIDQENWESSQIITFYMITIIPPPLSVGRLGSNLYIIHQYSS